MKLLSWNYKTIELNDNVETIKKLDYYYQDRGRMIKLYKNEVAKIESLPEDVKKALENISNMQELELKQIKLYEDMKHAILKKHNIKVYNFKFRNF